MSSASTGLGNCGAHRAAIVLLWVVAVGLTSWAALAIYFDLSPPRLRFSAPALYLVAIAVALSMSRRTIVRYAICLLGFLIVLACWLSLQPSNLRPWQSNLSQTPWAEISGDRVTIHNFRNCFYRRETDFTCEWPDKTVFLSQLRGMDLFMDYWGSPWIAHPIVSFQFGDGDYVAASIEARYQIGQNYSPMRSFFRQFTLVYVLAGERDLVRLRTNYRSGEKVYLYHLVASPQWSRSLFLQYLFSANKLRDQPRWFNALNDNCTTNIFDQMEATGHLPAGSSRFSWWVLLNGRAPEMLYRGGNFAGHLPFAELKEQALINPAANALDDSPDFSRRIRLNRAGFEFLHPQDAGTVSPRP